MRLQTLVAVVLLAAVACSSPDRASRMSPTAPSSAATAVRYNDLGGITGPMDVRFPPRNETYEFRNLLETKYQTGLGRSLTSTYVDREGEVVWLQEYIRYRVNGCDHETAIRNVLTQIDNQPAPAVCAENREFVIQFPPRNETLDFRRRLEAKYQSMGRGLTSTYVDIEGAVIWVQEYLRYRSNECDHATAAQKVNAQIDTGVVSETCVPGCRYRVQPSNREVSEAQQNFSFELIGEPGGCAWTASSDAAWLTFPPGLASGNNTNTIPYTVAQNVSGGARQGRISFAWPGGGTSHTVYQSGSSIITSFRLTDTFRSGASPTTECHLRSTATPCTFTVTSNMPGSAYVFAWTVTYDYNGVQKSVTGGGNPFSITDACGSTDSSASGIAGDLNVSVTVTDNLGNTQTVSTGAGDQPVLRLVKFSC